MSLSIDPNSSYAVLIGANEFIKEPSIIPANNIADNLDELGIVLRNSNILGIPGSNVTISLNNDSNTQLKELLTTAAEEATSAVIFYYSGTIIIRKGKLYLATPHSTKKHIHVNGVALSDLIDLARETEAHTKIFLFDALYTTADGESYGLEKVVSSAFESFENDLEGSYFISSAPSVSEDLGLTNNPASFTSALLKTLQEGLSNEMHFLSLNDVFTKTKTLLENWGNLDSPVAGKKVKKMHLDLFKNSSYFAFLELRNQADQVFDNKKFREALELYNKAFELYRNNDELVQRIKFIHYFLEAESLKKAEEYHRAKQLFEKAANIHAYTFVKESIIDCMEKIASDYYDQEKFEQAKVIYEQLIETVSDDIFYQNRLKICEEEVHFSNLIDEADAAYFSDEYEKAYELYQEAIHIHHHPKIAQRRDACKRFVDKEAQIRENVIDTVKEQIKDEYLKSINSEIDNKETQLKKQVEEELKNKIQKEQERLQEDSFWTRVSLWNNIEGYQFYLSMYPKGLYVTKAEKRLGQLKAKKQKEDQEKAQKEKEAIAATLVADQKEKETIQSTKVVTSKEQEPEPKVQKTRSKIELSDKVKDQIGKEVNFTEPSNTDATAVSEEPKVAVETIENTNETEATEKEINPVENDSTASEEQQASITQEEEEVSVPSEGEDITAETEESLPVNEAAIEIEEEPIIEEPKEPEVTYDHLSDVELWEMAVSEHTEESYMRYIDHSKDLEHLVDAYYFISQIHHNSKEEEDLIPTADDIKSQSMVFPVENEEKKTINSTERVEVKIEIEEEPEMVSKPKENHETSKDNAPLSVLESSVKGGIPQNGKTSKPIKDVSVATPITNVITQQDNPVKKNGTHQHQDNFPENGEKLKPISVGDIPSLEDEIPVDQLNKIKEDEEKTWESAKVENTVSGYYNYLNSTTLKYHWDEAKEAISILKDDSKNKEQEDWIQAQVADTIEAYNEHIKKYPLGNYYAKAMFRLNKLESERKE